MGAVIDPFARRRQPLSSRDRGGVTNDCHEIAVRARLARSTQKPLSALWNVTRSTVPAITSRSGWMLAGGTDIDQMIGQMRAYGERRKRP